MISLLFILNLSLYQQGEQVYNANCQVCHGDPKIGAYGPDIYGSSQGLIYYRLVKGGYPPYYTPKRGSKAMPVLAWLEPDVPAIYAYLNGIK